MSLQEWAELHNEHPAEDDAYYEQTLVCEACGKHFTPNRRFHEDEPWVCEDCADTIADLEMGKIS
jgi:formylmethanofuran dehydrogenase subunit E